MAWISKDLSGLLGEACLALGETKVLESGFRGRDTEQKTGRGDEGHFKDDGSVLLYSTSYLQQQQARAVRVPSSKCVHIGIYVSSCPCTTAGGVVHLDSNENMPLGVGQHYSPNWFRKMNLHPHLRQSSRLQPRPASMAKVVLGQHTFSPQSTSFPCLPGGPVGGQPHFSAPSQDLLGTRIWHRAAG